MASPYHHQHHPPTTTSCCCTTSCSSTYHCSQPQPQLSPDPLLQAIASQLLISNPPDPYLHQTPHKPHKSHHPKPNFQIQQQQLLPLHSLVSRIEALEASLHHHPSSNRSRSSTSHSLRDSAARVIQTHFRTFLVRRSRTLRRLKDIAFIKSSFACLKSSISNQTHFDFHSVSQKALALLIRLGSIQCGNEQIVRDGKRSISRDIARFLEFIEGVVVKRQVISLKPVKNVRKSRSVEKKCGGLGRDQREMIGNLRERIEKIRGFARVSENEEDVELEGFQHVSDDEEEEEGSGQYRNGAVVKRRGFQPKVKKSVSFAEDGNVYRVFSNSDDEAGSSGDGSDSSDGHGERVEHCGEVEDVKGFAQETESDDEEEEEGSGQYRNGAVVKRRGFQPKVKKSVSFAEDGNVYRVFSNSDDEAGSSGDGSDSSDGHGERVEHCGEVEDVKGFAQETEDFNEFHRKNGGSPQTSDAERNARARATQKRGHGQGQNEYSLFSAPLPVKMDSKEDVVKRNKGAKIVT